MKFQFLPENFSRSENAPPFETRKIRHFEVERIFLENKKMVEETSLVDCRSYRILMEQRCRSHSDSLFLRSLHSSWPGAYFCTLLRLGLSLDRFCPDVCHLWKSPIGAPTLLMYWATMIAIERISIYATNCKSSDRFVRQRKRWSTP